MVSQEWPYWKYDRKKSNSFLKEDGVVKFREPHRGDIFVAYCRIKDSSAVGATPFLKSLNGQNRLDSQESKNGQIFAHHYNSQHKARGAQERQVPGGRDGSVITTKFKQTTFWWLFVALQSQSSCLGPSSSLDLNQNLFRLFYIYLVVMTRGAVPL